MTPSEIRTAINADPAILALVPDTQAIADALSAGRTKIGEVTAHNIRQYLTLIGLLIPIEDATAMSCREAARVLEIFPIIDLANPMIAGKFNQVLTDLVDETLLPDFTEEHKQTILSFAYHPDPVGEMDVRKALWSDDGVLLL